MSKKSDKTEFEKRVRIVQEWIIEDWRSVDIVAQIAKVWYIDERQAKRYIKIARERLANEEEAILQQKRRTKILTLQKLKRSINDKFKGTPNAVRAILAVEKEIILLEGIRPAQKVEVTGKDGTDLFAKKTDDELQGMLEELLSKVNDK